MMEPRELIIGNWYNYKGVDVQWAIEDYEEWGKNIEQLIKPIQLTEEWLRKFLFENIMGDQWVKDDIRIALFQEGVTLIFIPNSWGDIDRHELKDRKVHKLQNLIFDLTEKELEWT